MKKTVRILIIAAVLAACNSNSVNNSASDSTDAKTNVSNETGDSTDMRNT